MINSVGHDDLEMLEGFRDEGDGVEGAAVEDDGGRGDLDDGGEG